MRIFVCFFCARRYLLETSYFYPMVSCPYAPQLMQFEPIYLLIFMRENRGGAREKKQKKLAFVLLKTVSFRFVCIALLLMSVSAIWHVLFLLTTPFLREMGCGFHTRYHHQPVAASSTGMILIYY